MKNHAQLRQIWKLLPISRRIQFFYLLAFTTFVSLTEVFSIGALLPFLSAISNPDAVFNHPNAQPFIEKLGINSNEELIFTLAFTFALISITVAIARIALVWFQTQVAMAIGIELSSFVYGRIINQPYEIHISRHSSEILTGTTKAEGLVYGVIFPFLQMTSALILFSFVTISLLMIEPRLTMLTLGSLVIIYALIALLVKARVAGNSIKIASAQRVLTTVIQESLGSIRDLILSGSRNVYRDAYKSALKDLHKAAGYNQVMLSSPRFAAECFGMTLIAIVACIIAIKEGAEGGIGDIFPLLGVIALAAQRLLPNVQQIYQAYMSICGYYKSTEDVLKLIERSSFEPNESKPVVPVTFNSKIELKDVGFRYTPESPWVFRNLNLTITKGSKIGFTGITGSGKTTFFDLIMGLLTPSEGTLEVDGVELVATNIAGWQRKISHVPQEIFLIDAGIEENIAFGLPRGQIDRQKILYSARNSRVEHLLSIGTSAINPRVGERGVRLSGGERQRVCIARALYREAAVLMLDEATSALDSETETAVVSAIEALDKELTVLVITHRLITLRNCDRVFSLENGKLSDITYRFNNS